MLRWREALKIGFCADRLIWARLGAGLRPRVIEKRVVTVSAVQGGPGWIAAIGGLKDLLQAARSKQAEASVILSSRFVRYAVVRWHPALTRREERLAQARHCFKEIYGDRSASWAIKVSDGAFGAPVLATAVESALLNALRQTFKAAGIPLASVEPYLTAAYTRFRGTMASRNATTCFSVIEPEDISTLVLKGARLESASHSRIHEDWTRELQGIRLQLAGEADSPGSSAFYVFAPEKPSADTAATHGVVRLGLSPAPGYTPLSDSALSMAMVGH